MLKDHNYSYILLEFSLFLLMIPDLLPAKGMRPMALQVQNCSLYIKQSQMVEQSL